MDLTKFKSTYPPGFKPTKERLVDNSDAYTLLATTQSDVIDITPGVVKIGKTVNPIGLVNIFSEKREVITEIRKPNKMATLGEMLLIWDRVDHELYQRLISIKYLKS